MKTIQYIICCTIAVFAFATVHAQKPCAATCTAAQKESPACTKHAQISADTKVHTETFTVEGTCNMCKSRIENAALIKGVKSAEWNKQSHELVVIYNPQKVCAMDIHKAVAQVGHKTSLVEANMDAYKKLPACCAYKSADKPSCGHSHH